MTKHSAQQGRQSKKAMDYIFKVGPAAMAAAHRWRVPASFQIAEWLDASRLGTQRIPPPARESGRLDFLKSPLLKLVADISGDQASWAGSECGPAILQLAGILHGQHFDVEIKDMLSILEEMRDRGYVVLLESTGRRKGQLRAVSITPLGSRLVEQRNSDRHVYDLWEQFHRYASDIAGRYPAALRFASDPARFAKALHEAGYFWRHAEKASANIVALIKKFQLEMWDEGHCNQPQPRPSATSDAPDTPKVVSIAGAS